MLDLETWGTTPGCAIRSIGAVVFSRCRGDVHMATFYRNVTRESCEAAGLAVEQGTADWWARQSVAARDALKNGQVQLSDALSSFIHWFNAVGGVCIWSQGAGFDVPIIEAACARSGIAWPWKFWDVRDTRTAYDLAGLDPRRVPREGQHHNAMDDAIHQARCVQAALKRLVQNGRLAAATEGGESQ